MVTMQQLILCIMCCLNMASSLPERGAFTSVVNMEKLYTMEDEMIALTDVILNHERNLHGDHDVHGIYNVTEMVTRVKTIHRDIVANKRLSSYIAHPINMFHLTKRLARNWSKVIAILENSKSCAKAMRVKIENMADNLPTSKDVQAVSHGILRLQAFYNIAANDVMSGDILHTSAHDQLTLDDAFDLARIAYEIKYYFLAIDWLKVVTSLYDPDAASFNLTNALNLMSSAYFKLQQPSKALETLDQVLKLDPNNQVAMRNSKYMIMKIDEGLKDKDITHQTMKGKRHRLQQKYCGSKTKSSSCVSFCTYTARRNLKLFETPNIETEVLSVKPLVVLYHNLTTNSQLNAVKHMGYEQMIDSVSKHHYSNPEGLSGLTIEDRTYWQWVPTLKQTLENLDISERIPQRSQFVVRNIGLDGHENTPLDQSERTRLGTYLMFLTDPEHGGGEIVFPKIKTKVTPRKGDVLFYERTIHKQVAICPVISDSMWVGVYPLHEPMGSDMCYKDNLRRPRP